ncbi:hypothetical protein [Tropicimonas sp. IMCC34011]|uniref:hypothetical protein n=1 Tax=Tropicimonas sp. IMCC34011 TaxID=2248759 RepID=UPI000E229B76|nr:hypothetical protein [Tropicimonas sp. IMCC34011]
MSNNESFIDEVNDEVRRDRLFRMMKRWGWIPILLVVLLVAGAAWYEYRQSREIAEARAFGDAVLTALELPDDAARTDALAEIRAAEGEMPVLSLLLAAERLAGSDPEASAEALRPVVADADISRIYGDLAAFKMVLLGEAGGVDNTTRAQLLERIATPGAPYRALAMEQQAIDLAAAGEDDQALELAQSLLDEPNLTQGLIRRVTQLIVALEGEPESEAG